MEASLKQAADRHRKLIAQKKAPFHDAQVEAELESSNATHIDVFYPPIGLSVGVEEAAGNNITWRRPADFMDFYKGIQTPGGTERTSHRWQAESKRVEVFDNGVQANDICQGELGNCWFMCSLGALCEFPQLVDRLFVHQWSKDETSAENRSSPLV